MGCIYYHKNKINGYMYIGQSKCNSDYIKYGRWGANGQGYKANKYFWHAIKKYGWENFEHGFFEDNISNELLNEKEKYYIALYHTYRQDPEYKSGYNLTPGGEGSMNTWWPEEDAWLVDNYSLDKKRDQLINEYRQAFPDSYHSDMAIKARLKTLRLSDAKNVNHYSEEDKAKLIHLYLTVIKAEVMAAFPGRNFDNLRKLANTFIKQKQIKEQRQVEQHEPGCHVKLKLPNVNWHRRTIECMPDYSKAEDEVLLNNYQEHGPQYCQDIIKEKYEITRSLNSIRDHATKVLKLHYHKKFTEDVGFDLSSFAKFYYNHSIKETAIEFRITEEQVKNIVHRNKFKRNKATIKTGTCKQIYCIELAQIFNGCRQAAAAIGKANKNFSNIYECCRGERKTAYGYHWKFIEGEN